MNIKNSFLIIITTILTTLCFQIVIHKSVNNDTFADYKISVIEKLKIERKYTSNKEQKERISEAIEILQRIEDETFFIQTLKEENNKLNGFYQDINTNEIKKNIFKRLETQVNEMLNEKNKNDAKWKLKKIQNSKSFTEYQHQVSELYERLNKDFLEYHKNDEVKPDMTKLDLRRGKQSYTQQLADFYEYTDNSHLKTEIEKLMTAKNRKELENIYFGIFDYQEVRDFYHKKSKNNLKESFGDSLTDKQIQDLNTVNDDDIWQEELGKYLFINDKQIFVEQAKKQIDKLEDGETKTELWEQYQKLKNTNNEIEFHKIYQIINDITNKILYPEI